jgi:hypothetical protein
LKVEAADRSARQVQPPMGGASLCFYHAKIKMKIPLQRVGEYVLLQLLAIAVVAVGLVFFVTLIPLWLHLRVSGYPGVGALVYVGVGWLLVGLLVSRYRGKFRGQPALGRFASARYWLFLIFILLCAMTFVTLLVNRLVFQNWFPAS